MTFIYEYRETSGARVAKIITASSREEVQSRLMGMGIRAISIREGGRLTDTTNRTVPKAVLCGILGVVLACGAVALLCWAFADGEKVKVGPSASRTVKAAKVENVPTVRKTTPAVVAEAFVLAGESIPPPREKNTNRVEKLPNGREIRINDKGERILCVNPVDPDAPVPKSIFKHEVESALAMYVKPAVMMPPLPRDYTDEEVRQALAEPMEMNMDEDDEDTLQQKRAVQAFKEQLREYLENGGTFAAYMRQLQKRQENEAAQMMASRKMIEKCLDENKPAEARELFDALNKHLEKQGIPPIKMTPKYRHLLH